MCTMSADLTASELNLPGELHFKVPPCLAPFLQETQNAYEKRHNNAARFVHR